MTTDEEATLGRLAVLKGFCTESQVEECRRLQSSGRTPAKLSDLLTFKGYLSASQLQELQAPREKRTMACPACGRSFTVLTRSGGSSARCPRCQGPLVLSDSRNAGSTDAEITTRRMKIPPPSGDAAGTISMVCVICNVPFQRAPDESARVRCPTCGSTFPVRNSKA